MPSAMGRSAVVRMSVSPTKAALAVLSRLGNPALWPQILRYAGLYLGTKTGVGQADRRCAQDEATAWCEERRFAR